LVGDQQAITWTIGVVGWALETWLYHEELRDLHQLYFLKSSQLDYLVSIIYPMFLLVVTCTQLIYIESYSPFAYVGFCILHVFVYVVLPTYFILSNQVCACWFAHHVWVFLLSILHIICI
jgi:hypothetical protein